MANKDIRFSVKVDDSGSLKRVNDGAKATVDNIDQLVNKVKALNTALKAVSSATLDTAKSRAGGAGTQREDLVKYNSLRGSAGAAGGTARDFAAQSQGLGGLVRLYATFAANLFAVTTAFNALKEAANVDKLIASSEKFSSVTGNNLRSIAKSLQVATDGTLAFQDAIKFTNIGTAAGLSGKQIENLTVIALGAANALGRDVGESIQRIIQGTAKQEQEILDELGIFVKSKKAFEEYANARNVKVDDLTARERTLAYADAVAKAGDQWKQFANIDDPYSQLLAQSREVIQSILSAVNNFVKPVVKAFADSEDAIKGFLVFITAALVNKAIPDLRSALLSPFKGVSAEAKGSALRIRNELVEEYTQLNAQLAKLKLKRDELLEVRPTRLSNLQGVVNNIGSEDLKPARGGTGLNATTITTAIYGAEKKPKDLSDIKNVEDVQTRIANTLKTQLKDEETRSAVLSTLVSKKILEEGSTHKTLILGEKSKVLAEKILADVNKQLLAEKAILDIEKQQVQVRGALRVSKSGLEQVGLSSKDVPVGGSTSTGTVGGIAVFDKASKAADAFRTGLAASNRALELNIATLNGGMKAGVLGYIAYMKGAAAGTLAAATGLGTFSRAAVLAGGAISFMGGTIAILGRAILSLLGPLSLAWTAWELFGDSIKEFLNYIGLTNFASKAAEERTKKMAEAYTDLTSSLVTTSVALEENTKKLENATGDARLKALEAQANAFREGYLSFEKYRESIAAADKDFAGTGATTDDIAKKYGKNNVEAVKQAQAVVTILENAQRSGALTAETSKQTAAAIDNIRNSVDGLGKGKVGADALKQALIDVGNTAEAASRQASAAAEKILATVQRGVTAAEAISKIAENVDSRKLESRAGGFKDNTDALELFKNLAKASIAYNNTLDSSNKTLIRDKEVESVVQLVQATKDFATTSAVALEVRKKVAKLLELEKLLATDNISTFTRLSTIGEAFFLKRDIFQLTAGSEDAARSLTGAFAGALKTAGNATEDLSGKVKAALAPIKSLIANIEAAIRGLRSAISVSDKVQGSVSKIGGTSFQADPRGIEVLQKEAELAERKAFASKVEAEIRAKGDKGLLREAQEQYDIAVSLSKETLKQETLLFSLNNIEKEAANTAKATAEQRERSLKALDSANNLAKANSDVEKERVNVYGTLAGKLSEEVSYTQAILDQKRAIAEQEAAVLKLIQEKASAEQIARDAANVALEQAEKVGGNAGSEQRALALAELDKQTAKIQQNFNLELTATQAVNNALNERTSIQLELLDLQKKQAKESLKVNKASEAFTKLFSGTGLAKQGKAIADIAKLSVSSSQKLTNLDKAEKKRKEAALTELSALEQKAINGSFRDYENLVDFKQSQNELDIEAAATKRDMELEYAAEALSSFKGLFDEKTAGYKILDGIERALHAVRMAESAERTARMIADGAKQIASLIATIAKDGVSAVLNQGKGDPYTAFARMAAMAAFVATLTGKGGGKAPSAPPGGTTAKDRQEVQGTGISFVDGVKKENGGGVLGDAEAKSESIKNSLEIIEKNSIEGLSFDNKMLKALESIDSAISGVSTSLYRIPGIRTGSAFGTVEGSQKGSSTLQNFVSQLFGNKSTSTEILDSGVKIAGTFTELAKATSGLINFYETIQNTTTKSRLFGLSKSTSTSIATNTAGASPEITQAVGSIFAYATDLFIDVGAKLGKSSQDILSKLETVSFDQLLSLRGLKGEELEKEFNAVISSMLDSTSNLLFAELKNFQKFGEGMLETVVRVVDGNKKVNDSLNAIGQNSALKSLGKSLGFEVSESLIDASGGLEEFQSRIGSFRDNFLTDTEKLAPVIVAVRNEMARLGHSTVDTRDEFKALVQSLDLTVPAQREMYVSLLEVSEAFSQVAEAAEKAGKQTLSAEDFSSRISDLEIKGLEALGASTQAVAAQRAKEIAELNKLVPAQADQLIYYQRILYAIEDAKAAREAEVELLGTLGFTYNQLVYQREVELAGINANLRAAKKWQFAVEDYNNSQTLLIELLSKSGDSSRALAITRERELKGLNSVDKAIKRAIFALEDEEVIRDKLQEAKDKELETKEKEYEAIKSSVSATKDYIKSLKDYRDSLLVGSLSPLNPLEKYSETQRQALEAARLANGPANTEEEKRIQKDARAKLQSTTNAFLEAARVLFASGSAYTSDFNGVLRTLDTAIAAAGSELSDADKQLVVLEAQKSSLKAIEEGTKSVAELTAELVSAQTRTADALSNVPEDLAAVYGVTDLVSAIGGLPQAILDLPTTLANAIASVTPTGTATLPETVATILGELGYAGTLVNAPGSNEAATQVNQAIFDIQSNSMQGNELARQLITEIGSLKDELVRMKEENRQNTEALIRADFRSSDSNAEQVQDGFDRSVRTLVFAQNNKAVLR